MSFVDIHGQHEHQSLLKTDKHIDILDAFGSAGYDKKIYELRRDVEGCYNKLRTLKERLSELENREKNRIKEEEFLRYQIREIEEAALNSKEDEELLSKKNPLQQMQGNSPHSLIAHTKDFTRLTHL